MRYVGIFFGVALLVVAIMGLVMVPITIAEHLWGETGAAVASLAEMAAVVAAMITLAVYATDERNRDAC